MQPRERLDKTATGSHIGNDSGTTRDYAMHIITRTRLTAFGRRHADAAGPLREWVRVMRRKQYRQHLEVRKDFPFVDFIGPRRAVFNVGGNKHRLVVDMRYDLGRVYVRHVVTHAEYDRLIKKKLL
jgi:mRNA interferase HigB